MEPPSANANEFQPSVDLRRGPVVSLEDVESTEAAILDAIGEAILVVEADGTVGYQSPAVAGVFGYAEDALVGTDATELVHPDDRTAIRDLVDGLEPGATERVEWRIADADGWSVDVEESAAGGARFAFRRD